MPVSEFRTLVEAHQRRTYRAALRVLDDRDEALDATQDAFLALHVHRAEIPPDRIAPWLDRVATNAAIDRRRKRRSTLRPDLPEQQAPDSDPVGKAAHAEERQLLKDGLSLLPERQRQVVTMRVVDQMTFIDIHTALGISDGATKMHFRRGVQALTAKLRRKNEREPS